MDFLFALTEAILNIVSFDRPSIHVSETPIKINKSINEKNERKKE